MKRREFITLVGGAASWPLKARAQQPATPVIGYLGSRSREGDAPYIAAVRRGLAEAGYVEGRNVMLEARWAAGEFERLPSLVNELIRAGVAVILTTGGTTSAVAAKGATTSIPIVFVIGSDPTEVGLVPSLNRPGGNITGIATLNAQLGAKQLEILAQLIAKTGTIAVLVNPNNPGWEGQWMELQAAAHRLGRTVEAFKASTPLEIDAAFAGLVGASAAALAITTDAFLGSQRDQIAALALRHRLPTTTPSAENARAGILIGYGPDQTETHRQAGIYVGRVLDGEKPAELPVQQAVRFALTLNLRTARALDLEIPATLLALADEVIE